MSHTKSIRELNKEGRTAAGGTFAAIPAKRKPAKPNTPPRKFTDEFKRGDEVRVIRTDHGWFDGRVGGKIVTISDYSCLVRAADGDEYEIEKPRDIYKCR